MKVVAKIIVFRHTETTDNRDKIFSGWRDVDLTEKGIKDAEEIGEKLKNEKVTKAYASDQLRSRRTLEIVLKHHSNVHLQQDPRIKDRNFGDLTGTPDTVPVVVDPRIKERDYGDLTGKSKAKTAKEFPKDYPIWHRAYDVPPPGGESIRDVEKRVVSFLDDLIQTLRKDDVIFISAHGNSIRPMRKYFEGLNNEEMATFEHEPGKIYSYET